MTFGGNRSAPRSPAYRSERRAFLRAAGLISAGVLLPGSFAGATTAAATRQRAWLVPGYHPENAWKRGRRILSDARTNRAIPSRHEGGITLVTRVDDASDALERALFPLRGHAITPLPGRRAVFSGMNDDTSVVFEVDGLDLEHRIAPARRGFVFGGHAALLEKAGGVVTSERSAVAYIPGVAPDAHYGVIAVRDPGTLAVLEQYSCGGIAPHDLAVLDDDRTLAIANYGSVPWPEELDPPDPPLPIGLEPCVTFVDLDDGRLLERLHGTAAENEIRHLAGRSRQHLAAIQARIIDFLDAQDAYRGSEFIYEPDLTDPHERGYAALPIVYRDGAGSALQQETMADPLARIQGQSIVHDPQHDEYLVTFTSSHVLAVYRGDGTHRLDIALDRLGLRLPRGIALHDDGRHYSVSGHWEGLYVFTRGDHALVREDCRYHRLFGHSHIARA